MEKNLSGVHAALVGQEPHEACLANITQLLIQFENMVGKSIPDKVNEID